MTLSSLRIDVACRALDPLLLGSGFVRGAIECDAGSGGPFASVSYERGNQQLALWCRGDLLSARYSQGAAELDHTLFMSLLGARDSKSFPCTGCAEAQASALASDLKLHGAGFLERESIQVVQLAAQHAKDPGRFRGFRGV
jgi:hypothetical protein